MLFKNENTEDSMLALGQSSLLTYTIGRRRTYRQRKKPVKILVLRTLMQLNVRYVIDGVKGVRLRTSSNPTTHLNRNSSM